MPETTLRKPGQRISIDSRRASGHPREGKVLEVLGPQGHEHYRVRWDDGEVSYYYPRQPAAHAAATTPELGARPVSPAEPGAERRLRAEPGDRLIVHGHRQGEPERDAEILAVRGEGGGPPFLVRWEDTGSESLLYPGSDVTVEHFPRRKRK